MGIHAVFLNGLDDHVRKPIVDEPPHIVCTQLPDEDGKASSVLFHVWPKEPLLPHQNPYFQVILGYDGEAREIWKDEVCWKVQR